MVELYLHFCIRFHGVMLNELNTETALICDVLDCNACKIFCRDLPPHSAGFLLCLLFDLKMEAIYFLLHIITTQKTLLFTFTSLRTSNPTFFTEFEASDVK
jgi:hypothetical protein